MGITKKQKEVYDYIKTYTHENGFAPTQREIKEHFGLKSFGSVQRYIKYLTDAGYLMNDENARRGLVLSDDTQMPGNFSGSSSGVETSTMEIPLLGKVAAGVPIEAIESYDDTISVPATMCKSSGRYFGLRVQGDSMIEDGILEDDIVVCKSQETANQGDTVVAVIEGEATVKNFFKNKGKVELHPANHRLSPIIVDRESGDFKIVGVLVGLIRSYV